jgi:integrase/recombinase XerC
MFPDDHGLTLADVTPTDLFGYLEWQSHRSPGGEKVVRMRQTAAAPATLNRRISAVLGLFEYLVTTGSRTNNPVPAARRASGLSGQHRVFSATWPPGRGPAVAWSASYSGFLRVCPPRTSPPSSPTSTRIRDRAMVLAMVLGGLRAAEVRALRLADVDMGLRRLRVVGKGGKERMVPVDGVFFAECAAYLRSERAPGCRSPECFVVLRGPTRGRPLTEAGLRKVFRTHRARSGATRVRPHRLRHTYGTELAAAGIDLLRCGS